jgi:hypothetical protein
MLEERLRADRLSQVINHTTAPAFLLGAVAGFLAIMLARVENLTRRSPRWHRPGVVVLPREQFLISGGVASSVSFPRCRT